MRRPGFLPRPQQAPRISPLRSGIHFFRRGGKLVLIAVTRAGEAIDEREVIGDESVLDVARELAEALARHERPTRVLRLER